MQDQTTREAYKRGGSTNIRISEFKLYLIRYVPDLEEKAGLTLRVGCFRFTA